MADTHNKIVANAAKSLLGPLGFVRKGRSRTWIADHNWWATVIEFQPSSWSKGSYLNVAAHWLWSDQEHLSFDFGGRIDGYVEYGSDAQFSVAVAALAERAANEALRLAQIFVSLPQTATVLLSDVREGSDGGWGAYNAAVAAGLAGFHDDVNEMLARVAHGFASPNSALALATKHISAIGVETENFRNEVRLLIGAHRAALRLPALSALPF